MSKEKIYTAEDLEICGFVIKNLFSQTYPNGLTASEIKEKGREHGWMRRVYDLVVAKDGN